MSRRFSSLLVLMAGLLALCGATAALARAPVAHATRGCGVGEGKGYGYTYLTSLTVGRTSCSTGRSVVKHHGHVHGWRCSRKRTASNPVQYDERESCASGGRQVRWTYTQNT